MTLYLTLFIAGMFTILLPCILPLIPIVLGVSIAGRSKWRPLLTTAGMLVSFIGFTFFLHIVVTQAVYLADYLRTGTYYLLFLFGLAFIHKGRMVNIIGALLGATFFWDLSSLAVVVAAVFGIAAMEIGPKVAGKIQQFGTDVQGKAAGELGKDNPITAFIMGLTMGLVWVPCAGPALGFAFTLVANEPGLKAFLALLAYGIGTAIPLLCIGYGGQKAVHSVRFINKYSGHIKMISGIILLLTALAFQFYIFKTVEIWLLQNTPFGNLGVDLEMKLFGDSIQ